MTTAGLEPATFWCRRRSKPNALPLRQVAILVNDPVLCLTLVIRLISLDNRLLLSRSTHDPPTIPTMALNWTMLNPDRTPVPLPNEITLMTVGSGADVSLTIPDSPPTGTTTSGGSGGERKLKGIGKLSLTDQRVPCFSLVLLDTRLIHLLC